MQHEQVKVTIASGASTSSLAQFSRIFPFYGLSVVTMSTGTVFGIDASPDAGSTFHQVMNPVNPNTSTVSNLTLQIGSNVGANGGFVNVVGGFKDFRIKCTGVVSGGVIFNVYGYDG